MRRIAQRHQYPAVKISSTNIRVMAGRHHHSHLSVDRCQGIYIRVLSGVVVMGLRTDESSSSRIVGLFANAHLAFWEVQRRICSHCSSLSQKSGYLYELQGSFGKSASPAPDCGGCLQSVLPGKEHFQRPALYSDRDTGIIGYIYRDITVFAAKILIQSPSACI